jgi:thymidine kinase
VGKRGQLIVISGPMFSNKSGELLRQVVVREIAGQKVAVLKHLLDSRYAGKNFVSTHGGSKREAKAVGSSAEVAAASEGHEVVAIDEAQFFDAGLPGVCRALMNKGTSVIASGLDMNFRGEGFGPMPELLAMADEVMKLHAVCMKCRSLEGTMTQRLIDGQPADWDAPLIQVGASETYEARCRDCHEIGKGRQAGASGA